MMIRRTAATAAAALTALAAIGACTSDDATSNTADTTTSQSSDTTTAPPSDEPIDLGQVPDGDDLRPGTYSVGLLSDDGPTRALVEVPEGYFSAFGGTAIGSDTGDMAFWGKVTQVDTDPCLGGKHVEAGTSVHDLAVLLAAQRHMKASQPVPVTIGNYHGVYLKLTAPEDIHRCRGGIVTIYGAGDDWLQFDVPNATFHEWILNVRGERVVGGARIMPDAANRSELIGMVRSATFTAPNQP
jgi:hypothetical protein